MAKHSKFERHTRSTKYSVKTKNFSRAPKSILSYEDQT